MPDGEGVDGGGDVMRKGGKRSLRQSQAKQTSTATSHHRVSDFGQHLGEKFQCRAAAVFR